MSQRLVNCLKKSQRLFEISTHRKHTVTIKTFGNENEDNVEIKEYSFCVRYMSGCQNIYVTGFRVPLVCSPLSGQQIAFVKTMFPCLASLDLAHKDNGNSERDLLIGANFYWYINEGELRPLSSVGLMAV